MSILNRGWVYDSITRNQDSGSVSYRWTHGATDTDMGSGIFYYAIPYFLKAKVCVCLGSGGGYVPRLMVDCIFELNETHMYGENETGEVYVVDATNNINGEVDWSDEDSFLRENFNPRFINSTTEDAFYNFFVKRDIKIDYLHIDADHTFDGCKKDFELYSQIMNKGGIITIHDTDKDYVDNFVELEGHKGDDLSGPADFVKSIDKRKFEVFNLFNHNIVKWKPSSTGITIVRKK